MKKMRMHLLRFLIVALLILSSSMNSYAYLDLGTGSYFIQIVLAASLGTLYSIKIFWKNIKSFLKNIFSKNKNIEKNA